MWTVDCAFHQPSDHFGHFGDPNEGVEHSETKVPKSRVVIGLGLKFQDFNFRVSGDGGDNVLEARVLKT
jgi:hypothetical protein